MSDDSKTREGEGAIDLLALLYPESEGQADEAGVSDVDSELGQMLGLRSLFGAMPDEEPPDAISNRLLALAAQHAKAKGKRESSGLWAWFGNLLTPLWTHPGLAAAASLVLVAGVAGTLYYKNGNQVAEPMAKSGAQAPQAGAAVSEKSSAADTEIRQVPPAGNKLNAEEGKSAEPIPDTEDTPALGDILSPGESKGESKGQPKPEARKRESKTAVPLEESESKKERMGGMSRKSKTNSSSLGIGQGASGPPTSSRTKKPRAPRGKKPSGRPPSPTRPVGRDPEADQVLFPGVPSSPQGFDEDMGQDISDKKLDSSKDALGSSAVPTTKAAALHRQAKAAAKRGDCQLVRRIGQQIRKLDSAYYDTRYLADPGLKACRSAKSK